MKTRAVLVLITSLVCTLLVAGTVTTMSSAQTAEYACPMSCEDDKGYQDPGSCPHCGMALVKRSDILDVAILIFDGVQIIDFTGPYEVFGQEPFNVFTVSETGETVTTSMEMSVNPKYSFATSPEPDVLVVPGGGVNQTYENPRVIEWIRKSAEGAQYVLSVCNGAFILAQAGLLDGRSATTFYGLIDDLKEFRPAVNVVSDQRFVDNGKVITSAGLSSGIDASLHLVSKLKGKGEAQRLALHLEYDWRPDSGFARAALADMLLPQLSRPEGAEVTIESTQGGRDEWEIRYLVSADSSVKELLGHVEGQLEKLENWTRTGSGNSGPAAETRWTLTDAASGAWESVTLIEPVDGEEGEYRVTMRIRSNGRRIAEKD